MANVHRIGDYRDQEANRGQGQRQVRMGGMFGGQPGGEGPNQEDMRNNPLIQAFTQGSGDPRQENFWTMLKTYFCPAFTWKSFIFLIVFIDIVMFIISIADSDELNDDYFLGINVKTLCKLGAKDSRYLHQGQIYRWVTPMVLHTGFLHILQNMVFQMIIGSLFEIIVGPLKFFGVYIVSGIGGVLMSALINDNISVGASTALFGITGGLLAFIIVNWVAMETMKEMRCCIMCFVIILLVINVMFGLSSTKNIDNYGHLGGFVTGLPFSMAIMPVLQTSMRRHQLSGWTYEKY